SGAAMLAITNKAINTIAKNIWANYKPQFAMPLMHYANFSAINIRSYTHDLWRHGFSNVAIDDINTIDFNYYGYNPSPFIKGVIDYNTSFGATPRMMKTEALVAANNLPEGAVKHQDEEAKYEGFDTRSDNGSSDNGSNVNDFSKIALREQEVKTALWMPNLVTDEQGNYAVEFEVPNFNTTWLVQTLAYTANGYFEGLQRDAVSSKPIMVKASMPRFLRVGDNATLAANVANKSDESAAVNGIIELFDPRTGKVIATKSFNLTLDAMCDTAVDINYTATTDASFIGFRIKASNGTFGDGEQVMVPILSNISPITETLPFFINANDFDFTAQFPNMKGAEKAVIEYCDNPVWYCATALPTIFDKDAKTSTSLVHSLFALRLAQGLAKQNPKLAEAIDYWKQQDREKSPLTSALERNSDLKIGTLLASPWINEADRQTLRMNELDKLFNDNYCTKISDEIVSRLVELQLPDGGFTWIRYSNCTSSLFCTGEVLEILGRLKKLSYLNADSRLNTMIEKAVKYFDSEHLELFKKLKKKDNMICYDDYAFVRTLYPEIAMPDANKAYVKRIIYDIEKDWKDHSLARKAFFALTLQNNGKTATARQITESIRQFSITTEQRGMYWDRIDNGWWRGRNPLAVTSVILQALQQVDNRTDEIDQIRKWILLNKQTNDWGGSSLASEAVYTILSTGSQWLTPGETPTINIGNTPVIFDEIDRYLGYSRKEMAVADVMGKTLNINRSQSNSPAWGALYLQGKAPMKSIKSARVDDLSIEKVLLTYTADGTLRQTTSLKVGDKVRVQCTIKCGKHLEYLTLTDERGACFEPVDKMSGNDFENGVWMYREIKDSQTNIFIPWLNKGTYVIGYDVYVTNPGTFDVGIATVQCQYAPQFTAHSSGCNVVVK
ncbi:MAG: alpha-2-macroglobulin family protein, partial [Muribaculaceae bacterium]